MTPKILVLNERLLFNSISTDILYNISDMTGDELYEKYNSENTEEDEFITWLIKMNYCTDVPDEQIEYFYY